mmetsp:Transcript_11788/g.13692  ORF Transcript_11788/g.13692 Transcript_11788/m.13692 type:complete len:619 (-) Transcript_11788:113-1969(-)
MSSDMAEEESAEEFAETSSPSRISRTSDIIEDDMEHIKETEKSIHKETSEKEFEKTESASTTGTSKSNELRRRNHASKSSENLSKRKVTSSLEEDKKLKSTSFRIPHIVGSTLPDRSVYDVFVLVLISIVLLRDWFTIGLQSSTITTKLCDCINSQVSFRQRKVPELVKNQRIKTNSKDNEGDPYDNWKQKTKRREQEVQARAEKGFSYRFWLLNSANSDAYWAYLILSSFILKYIGSIVVMFVFFGDLAFPKLLDLGLLSMAINMVHFYPGDRLYARFSDDFFFRSVLQFGVSLHKIRKIFKTIDIANQASFNPLTTIVFAVLVIQIAGWVREGELYFSNLPVAYTFRRFPIGVISKIFTIETMLVATSAVLAQMSVASSTPFQSAVFSFCSWVVLQYRYERKVISKLAKVNPDKYIYDILTNADTKNENLKWKSIFRTLPHTSQDKSLSFFAIANEARIKILTIWKRIQGLFYLLFQLLSPQEMRFRTRYWKEEFDQLVSWNDIASLIVVLGYLKLSFVFPITPIVIGAVICQVRNKESSSNVRIANWRNFCFLCGFILDAESLLFLHGGPSHFSFNGLRALLMIWFVCPVPEIKNGAVVYSRENGIAYVVKCFQT